MTNEVVVPHISSSVKKIKIMIDVWHKQTGELVWQGERLVELETDKAVCEVRAETTGILEVLAEKEANVCQGEVIANIHERYYGTQIF
ncbi:MAG: biotin/lipoyl-containing protein [Thermonemataceae bacterium]